MSEEERPGSGCCSAHRLLLRWPLAWLGSARFCSACPSRQLAALIKAQSSAPPSAAWHQSGLAMHKAPLKTLPMLPTANANSSLRPWAKPRPTYSITPAACPAQRRHRRRRCAAALRHTVTECSHAPSGVSLCVSRFQLRHLSWIRHNLPGQILCAILSIFLACVLFNNEVAHVFVAKC